MLRLALVIALAAADACSPPTKSCSETCTVGCCDENNRCQAGTSRQACGTGGELCALCGTDSSCSGRACTSPGGAGGGAAGGSGNGGGHAGGTAGGAAGGTA